MPSRSTNTILAVVGVAFLFPCLFFLWYCVRLLTLNIAMSADEAAAHRTGGMLIGAIAFPLATIIFGVIGTICLRRGLKGLRRNDQ
jgi:hypothetical protein